MNCILGVGFGPGEQTQGKQVESRRVPPIDLSEGRFVFGAFEFLDEDPISFVNEAVIHALMSDGSKVNGCMTQG
jgi:hypothetical protein